MNTLVLSPNVIESMHDFRQALQNAITFGVIAAGSDLKHQHEAILENSWNLMLEQLYQLETAFDHAIQALDLQEAL